VIDLAAQLSSLCYVTCLFCFFLRRQRLKAARGAPAFLVMRIKLISSGIFLTFAITSYLLTVSVFRVTKHKLCVVCLRSMLRS